MKTVLRKARMTILAGLVLCFAGCAEYGIATTECTPHDHLACEDGRLAWMNSCGLPDPGMSMPCTCGCNQEGTGCHPWFDPVEAPLDTGCSDLSACMEMTFGDCMVHHGTSESREVRFSNWCVQSIVCAIRVRITAEGEGIASVGEKRFFSEMEPDGWFLDYEPCKGDQTVEYDHVCVAANDPPACTARWENWNNGLDDCL